MGEERRRRQWGAERRTAPLPIVHAMPTRRAVTLSRVAPVVTVLLWVAYVITTVIRDFLNGPHDFRFTMESVGYVVVVTLLTFSATMYLVARQGALDRFRRHVRAPRAELDRHFAARQPPVTVLVPSYSEEPHVVRATLLSAALQEYPILRVVLLLDDPPFPTDPAVCARLEQTRALPRELRTLLAEPYERAISALIRFELNRPEGEEADADLLVPLAELYEWCADWLGRMADGERIADHVDLFFVEHVLRDLGEELMVTANALRAAVAEGVGIAGSRAHELHRRLTRIFGAQITVFERKRYASLPHDANKAMNLNAYIALMGARYRSEPTPQGTVLVPVPPGSHADVSVPDSDYVLTLDADSILLRDYCTRLVHFLEQPANARVAVVQTPYSSFRGAATRIERLAAATTDLQHLLHQGMTRYGATFWVGANAVIRKKALDDIVEVETVGGFEVRRYVQDRTVIEDTESSLDLVTHGWSLVNYPERLSYSATPPDFGSLVVQRRRWANGGLLILPKLFREYRRRARNGEPAGVLEMSLRLNYMASISWASFGLVFLLAYPYDSRLLSPVVLAAALPYFLAMASDLHAAGYKRSDVLRIYGFNLILLPVNLAGVLKSIQQALTGTKIPFARTPKVRNRTAAPALYVLAPIGIVAFSIFTGVRDMRLENWPNAAFAAFNALLALYAIVAFIGIGAGLSDVVRGAIGLLYVERRPRKEPPPVTGPVDWRAMLYHGTLTDGGQPSGPQPRRRSRERVRS